MALYNAVTLVSVLLFVVFVVPPESVLEDDPLPVTATTMIAMSIPMIKSSYVITSLSLQKLLAKYAKCFFALTNVESSLLTYSSILISCSFYF